jgi:hypothetical protein
VKRLKAAWNTEYAEMPMNIAAEQHTLKQGEI